MHIRILSALALGATLLSACDQVEQSLPFDPSGGPVTRTVPDGSTTTLSSAAGASIRIPAGAVPAGATVTLTPSGAPAWTSSGRTAATHAFEISSSSAPPTQPMAAELKIGASDSRAWLAAVRIATPTGIVEIGDAAADLAAGVLRTKLPVFGILQAVLPDPDATFSVGRIGAAPSIAGAAAIGTSAEAAEVALPTRALRGACGAPEARCTGLQVQVSDNLDPYVTAAAVVFPQIGGEIRINGSMADGALVLDAPLRLRLTSGVSAVTVPVRITIRATSSTIVTEVAGALTLSGVRVHVESSQDSGEETMTLQIHYDGAGAWLEVERNIGASLSRVTETAAFSARVPLVRVQ